MTEGPMQGINANTWWRFAYWTLGAMFALTAALNMLHVKGGFFTNYAADLLLPPWLYIVLRGLGGARGPADPVSTWVGRSPTRAAGALFLGSTATELSQIRWPKGFFSGTFDPFDIVAYGAGLTVCYLSETYQARRALIAATTDRATETSSPSA